MDGVNKRSKAVNAIIDSFVEQLKEVGMEHVIMMCCGKDEQGDTYSNMYWDGNVFACAGLAEAVAYDIKKRRFREAR